MHFKSIELSEWQQFSDVKIDFHDRLTILTGANGSGKTTLLNLLAKHCGWNVTSLSTPKREENSDNVEFVQRSWNGEDRSDFSNFGSISYSNDMKADLRTQNSNAAIYETIITGQRSVYCFYIPSHRSVYRYEQITKIPTAKKGRQKAVAEIHSLNRQRYRDGSERKPASYFMKNALIGWAIQRYGGRTPKSKVIMPADTEQISNFEDFECVLRKILPKSLGFKGLAIRNMEVVLICNDGRDEFLLEAASGGISALVDMAWQIHMFSTDKDVECTVIIDEVENHLHPLMQRHILSDLLSAFPKTKFIVSTHSPLVVGSVQNSNIYALLYNDKNKIESIKLDFDKKAKTAAEILDEALGVSVTMPVWAEIQLESILEKYAQTELTEDTFIDLRNELRESGLGNMVPSAIGSLLDRYDD